MGRFLRQSIRIDVGRLNLSTSGLGAFAGLLFLAGCDAAPEGTMIGFEVIAEIPR